MMVDKEDKTGLSSPGPYTYRKENMPAATLDRQFRITIPAEVRHRPGLHPGDVLRLESEGDRIIITKSAQDETSGDPNLENRES